MYKKLKVAKITKDNAEHIFLTSKIKFIIRKKKMEERETIEEGMKISQ